MHELMSIHIGHFPSGDDDGDAWQSKSQDSRWGKQVRQSVLNREGIDWQGQGVEPRWVGYETADCVAALNPNIYHGRGDNELRRFLEGAASRDEVAILVSTIGYAEDTRPRSVLHPADDSVSLVDLQGSVSGQRLPIGARPTLADDLHPADRDLGLRLLNRDREAPWWKLKLSRVTMERGSGGPPVTTGPDGELHPVLVDALGNPVVAAWVPADGRLRWYIIPDVTDWHTILDWLVHQALPGFVPTALQRYRTSTSAAPALETPAETSARSALADLDTYYAEERARLEAELSNAQLAAEPVRTGLLYGQGGELVRAVGMVLTDAGFATIDLDTELRGSWSADLVVNYGEHRRLVEVKSQGGNASESLVGALQKHLGTWGELKPDQHVDGGTLVVNHLHKLPPGQRTRQVYSRPEFVNTLPVPVVSTLDLFDWWRKTDWQAIREAVLGTAPQPPKRPDSPTEVGRKRWFRRT